MKMSVILNGRKVKLSKHICLFHAHNVVFFYPDVMLTNKVKTDSTSGGYLIRHL